MPRSLADFEHLPPLPGVRHRYVQAGEVRLHLAEIGPEAGPPVLLVHGWPQHWWEWRKVVAKLPSHRCLMPDLRGFGWSEAPADGYEKSQLAEDMLCLLDALEIERVCFVGHDWGAITGFLLALRAPDRVSSLLAMSVPHLWASMHDRLNPRRLAAFLYQIPLSTPILSPRLMRRGLTKRALEVASTPGTFSAEEMEVYDERLSSPQGARVTMAMYRTFLLRELPRLLRRGDERLEVPTRLLVGERDPIVQGADLLGHERNAPGMTVEWVEGAAHFLPEERPDLVAARVRELCPAE